MKTFFITQWRRLRHWQQSLPVGVQIAALAISLVCGRYLWVCLNRPAHRMELADAYSINLFYGTPQPNSTGKQLTCVGTADLGFAVFLVDTSTGQKRNVQEQNTLGPWGSFFDLKVWPWSPEDSLFVYSASNHFFLCDSGTGRVKGEVYIPVEVMALTWVSPETFVCVGQDHALYRIQKRTSGAWEVKEPIHAVRISASSHNEPQEGAAKAFDGSTETKWYNNNRPGPWWLEYQFSSGVAHAVSEYHITSANDAPGRDPQDWELQGSNDNLNWITLDVRRGETFAGRLQTQTYFVKNRIPYQAYRLFITKQAGPAEDNMQISELALFAAGPNGGPEEVSSQRDPFAFPVSLQTLGDGVIGWVSVDCLWSMDLASNRPVILLNCQQAISRNTHLHKASYSKHTGRYLLSCTQDQKPLLYQFDPRAAENGLQAVPTGAGSGGANWLAGAEEQSGWIGQQGPVVVVQRHTKPEVPAALSWAKVETLTLTGDGRHAFLLGTTSNEPAAGIWQFDLTTGQLQPVVSYANSPSPYARRLAPVDDFILSGEGKYTVYLPADFYQHPNRKRPLIVGDTDFGFAMKGAYGRMWAPALAACNAFVIISNRKDWFGGLDQWGERVEGVIAELSARLPIDQQRMFLFGVSAETTYVGRFMTNAPGRWRGVMLLNPTGLPDFSGLSSCQPMPKVLVSVGSLEGQEKRLQAFQERALAAGSLVELVVAPGEEHHLVGNAAQRQRTRAMINFVFGE